jgi:hypothetical protein
MGRGTIENLLFSKLLEYKRSDLQESFLIYCKFKFLKMIITGGQGWATIEKTILCLYIEKHL